MKEWFIAAGCGLAFTMLFPTIKKHAFEYMLKGIVNLFAFVNTKIINSKYEFVPEEDRAAFATIVKNLVLCYVMMAEILLPDKGLGKEKKNYVLTMIKSHGLSDKIAESISDAIDEAVVLMDKQLREEEKKLQ